MNQDSLLVRGMPAVWSYVSEEPLGSLQEEILIYLAKHGPSLIYPVSSALRKSYAPTFTAFKSLCTQHGPHRTGLVGRWDIHGKRVRYWLTTSGIAWYGGKLAGIKGTSVRTKRFRQFKELVEQTIKVKDDKALALFVLNLHEIVEDGPDVLEDLLTGMDPGGAVFNPDLYPGVLAKVAKALREYPDLRADILDGYRTVLSVLEG